jgi:hypothetical protein
MPIRLFVLASLYGSFIPPRPPNPPAASRQDLWEMKWATIAKSDWGRRGIRMIRPMWDTFRPTQSLWDGSDPATGYDLVSDAPPPRVSLRWADGTPSGLRYPQYLRCCSGDDGRPHRPVVRPGRRARTRQRFRPPDAQLDHGSGHTQHDPRKQHPSPGPAGREGIEGPDVRCDPAARDDTRLQQCHGPNHDGPCPANAVPTTMT